MAFFKFRQRGQPSQPEPTRGRGRKNEPAASGPQETIDTLRRRARHRLIGAAVLVGLAIIGFPLLFDTQPRPVAVNAPITLPDKDKVAPLRTPDPVPAAASLGEREEMVSGAVAPRGGERTASASAAAVAPARRASAEKPAAPTRDARPDAAAADARAKAEEAARLKAEEAARAKAAQAKREEEAKAAQARRDDDRSQAQTDAQADARIHGAITLGTPHADTWWGRYSRAPNGQQMRLHSDWLAQLQRQEPPQRAALFTCWSTDCSGKAFNCWWYSSTARGITSKCIRFAVFGFWYMKYDRLSVAA